MPLQALQRQVIFLNNFKVPRKMTNCCGDGFKGFPLQKNLYLRRNHSTSGMCRSQTIDYFSALENLSWNTVNLNVALGLEILALTLQ